MASILKSYNGDLVLVSDTNNIDFVIKDEVIAEINKDTSLMKTGDLEFTDSSKGVILNDRDGSGNKYRLYIEGGELKIEQL